MMKTYTHGKLTWVDLKSPTRDEVKELMTTYGITPDVGDELLAPTRKPHVEDRGGFIYLILHFPAIKHTHSNQTNQEVDFLIGKDFLITVRYDTVDAIHKFTRVFEVHNILTEHISAEHGGLLFYFLVTKLYRSLEHELEYIESHLEEIEDDIFLGKEKEMVYALSETSRNLLDFEKAVSYHDDVLKSLDHLGQKIFGEQSNGFYNKIRYEYRRIRTIIKSNSNFLHELRETNDSLLSTKQNEVMKVLTVLAFITFPAALIAGIFGMNSTNIPIIGHPSDFWIIISIILLITITLFAFFKYKKWL